jgi:hypothetical protein
VLKSESCKLRFYGHRRKCLRTCIFLGRGEGNKIKSEGNSEYPEDSNDP